ncbi:MAG: NUDIX hydrolase [Gammaproteobacteria bacterium]|nr:NUDIX hydrolase [Gammaproteobacteria bacterium]MCP5196686.1 NUDIX hydrolase [Gammaproteobacteria bacterium]
MKFCSQCGASVTLRVPTGDNLPRYVCASCHTIHYQNPRIVAGCIPEWEGRILLCRRAIEPRYGLWTLPAGFMENSESAVTAAAREALEEANAVVENLSLYGVYSLLHVSQVYLMFRSQLKDGRASPGQESLEVRLYTEDEVPWEQMAFTVVHEILHQYFAERRSGVFQLHVGDIIREADTFRIHRYS